MTKVPMIVTAENETRTASRPHAELSGLHALKSRLIVSLEIHDAPRGGNAEVTLRPRIALDGVGARVVARSPRTGPGHGERSLEFALLNAGQGMGAVLPALTCQVPPGARTTLRAFDRVGRPLGPERDAGACRPGTGDVSLLLFEEVQIVLHIALLRWSEQEGLVVDLSGRVVFLRGVELRLGFRLPVTLAVGTQRGSLSRPLIQPGSRLTGPHREMTGLDPDVELRAQLLDEKGMAIDQEHVVGRCALVG